jgi:hypothetical protein
MNVLTKFAEQIIKASFNLSVWLIERFNDMSLYNEKTKQMSQSNDGTLAKDISECLIKNNLRLVPGYESHDLKHVLLNYQMTPVDEIRMQAFMIGNGNISLPSIAIFLYGFILLPHKWLQLFRDFRLGLFSKSIKTWSIEEFGNKQTSELRKQVLNVKQKEFQFGTSIAYMGSISAIAAGIFGMIYCLPYLFSPLLEDLVGAGFPFIGGAILFGSGLISFSIQSRNKKQVTSVEPVIA